MVEYSHAEGTAAPNSSPPSASGTTSPEPVAPHERAHHMEKQVRHRLLSDPQFHFSSLVVHRTKDGLCLEGVLETDGETPDLRHLVREISGVDHVLDHLVRHSGGVPRKG